MNHVRDVQLFIYSSHLAENNGHEEEVEQQRLWQMTVVEGEEEEGEEDGHILVGGTAVGGTEQLQACHCDHQSAHPGRHFREVKHVLTYKSRWKQHA